MIQFIDVVIKKVEKICNVTKTTHSYEERDSYNKIIRTSYYDTYESTISTRVLFDNGEQIDFEYDIPLIENWIVRYVYEDDLLIYKVCLENSFILFDRTKNNEFSYLYSLDKNNALRQLFFNEDISKPNNQIQKYKFSNEIEYNIQYSDLTIIKVEKISLLDRNGSSYINTRLFFTDNSSKLFEKLDIPVLPGWHLRKISAGYLSYNDLTETDLFIVENKYRISQKGDIVDKEKIQKNLHSEYSNTFESKPKLTSLNILSFVLFAIAFFIFGFSYWTTGNPFLGNIRNLSNYSFDKINTLLYPDLLFILSTLLLIATLIIKQYLAQKFYKKYKKELNEFLNTNAETVNKIYEDYISISLKDEKTIK